MTVTMQMGSRGDAVRALQRQLQSSDPALKTDGVFGPQTERAVRAFQRRVGLYPPDGIVGRHTAGALQRAATGGRAASLPGAQRQAGRNPGALGPAVANARQRATTAPAPRGEASPVADMHMSLKGRNFIFDHEAQRKVSHALHHPTAASGVTIGAGYDMKERTAAAIERDLILAKVPAAAARIAAQGAGLSGARADAFVAEHKTLLNLSEGQQRDLIVHVIPHYEAIVKRRIRVALHQQEFDALVSYVYNPGKGWPATARLVNAGQKHDAMLEIKRHVRSGNRVVASLVRRREAETRMFLYGEYA